MDGADSLNSSKRNKSNNVGDKDNDDTEDHDRQNISNNNNNNNSDIFCRSQWLRGLRRKSVAAPLLRSWVRMDVCGYLSVVSVVCCQVEVSATS